MKEIILQRLPSIRKEIQRSPTQNSQQIVPIEDPPTPPEHQSAEMNKGKKYGLHDYFRVKKYKNYVDWLKVNG